jgi:hypothetical protein
MAVKPLSERMKSMTSPSPSMTKLPKPKPTPSRISPLNTTPRQEQLLKATLALEAKRKKENSFGKPGQ